MGIDQSRIDDLVARPSESLNVEIKRWINPAEPEGQVKIIKAAFAIRNSNGGFLLIGFDDETLLPDQTSAPSDVQTAFHLDVIQGLISRYASEPFEIAVGFATRDGQKYPVVVVPKGVRTPVAVKRDLPDPKNSNRALIREGELYFRTLASNGTPSTSLARALDWAAIIEICFENREADIGRFFRRHVSGMNMSSIVEALTGLMPPTALPPPTLKDRAYSLLVEGEEKLRSAITSRQPTTEETVTLEGLAWSVALIVDPAKSDAICDKAFLNAVMGVNPQYIGWPVWLDSRGFVDQAAHPHVIDKAWQAFIVSLKEGWSAQADFMRIDPKGEFYLWRLLQDDLTDKVRPGTALDPILVLIRVAEAIAVGLSIAKGLGWDEDARLGFAFHWAKLKGRNLASWAHPSVSVSGGHAYTDDVETYVEIPLDAPVSAIAPFVEQATRDLFAVFDGYTMPSQAVEHWVKKLVERSL
jgi:Putative DNA-binding domain